VTGSLEDKVRDAFAQDGGLSRAAEQFRERSGQTEMAMAVARTIDKGGVLVVEAGTGVGKTFSYLVPALLSGERVLLSTATKTLQDQLFGRDLPRLVEAFGLPVRTARSSSGPRPREPATWPSCPGWTSARRSFRSSLPRARTAWARSARSSSPATSTWRGARRWRPMWWSSTITCSSPILQCARPAWRNCCRP